MDNLNIKPIYENGELMRYDISPADGYILRVKCCDQTYEENGKIIFRPYRTLGDAGVVKTYDFENNPSGFIAEIYHEGMEDEIIETHPENNNTPELTEDIIEKAAAYDILMGASE
jgi:hypothetical protein